MSVAFRIATRCIFPRDRAAINSLSLNQELRPCLSVNPLPLHQQMARYKRYKLAQFFTRDRSYLLWITCHYFLLHLTHIIVTKFQRFVNTFKQREDRTHISGINASIGGSQDNFFSLLTACLISHQKDPAVRKIAGELSSLPLEDHHGTHVAGGQKMDVGRNRATPPPPKGREYFQYFAQQADGPPLQLGYKPAGAE